MRLAAALLLPLLAVAVPTRVEAASRLYPYVGVVYRMESHKDRSPDAQTLAQVGAAYSLGKFAPGANVKLGLHHVELELSVRYSLR